MSNYSDAETSAFVNDETIYNKDIHTIPTPDKVKGVDLDGQFYDDVIEAAEASMLDIDAFSSLNQGANDRNQMYNMYDVMCEDGSIGAVVRVCAEDATERNENGQIVWVESPDTNTAQYVTYLLDTLNVDKYVFEWVYSLCKYGDLYLRLYRESEYTDSIFDKKKGVLNEDVKLKTYSKNDRFAHYIEMVNNPAKMFELTRFGKTMGYVEASVNNTIVKNDNTLFNTFRYKFRESDVKLYPATEFVHAALIGNKDRDDTVVDILMGDDEGAETHSFKVRKGQSVLSEVYQTWRNVNLLENSILLNRVTKSSILRLLNIEVGDMPKEDVKKVISRVKTLIEQKMALAKNIGMGEYTNPGPIENTVYVPTRNNQGQVTASQIGGDVDVKSLADLDHYISKMYGQLGVPKQYFGWTDDSTGFNGGTSLTIISSRYAKTVKRLQNTILQALTDAINIMLIDKGLDCYVNNFTLQMLPPTTQEEIDRRDNMSNKVQLTRDIMDMLSDVETPITKLKILKTLLSNILTSTEVTNLMQEEIDNLEKLDTEKADETQEVPEEETSKMDADDELKPATSVSDDEVLDFSDVTSKDNAKPSADEFLPSPQDLGVNLSVDEEPVTSR